MGKLVIMKPQQGAQIIDFEGGGGGDDVQLPDLYRLIGCDLVDRRQLPLRFKGPDGRKRGADIWFDDEGLLNDDVPANRQLPDGTIIAGTILCCIFDDQGDTLAMTEFEAAAVMAFVSRWRVLREGAAKPEPGMGFAAG